MPSFFLLLRIIPMNVCRRVCGYLGVNFFNQGRTEEIKERVLHLGSESGRLVDGL